jgi:uncharacterized protein
MLDAADQWDGADRKRIAVVGSGISGLAAAWLLSLRQDVVLFEKDLRLGGHAHTVDVEGEDGPTPVDTGFIVFNPKNYPNLTRLFAHLDVETVPSEMSFAVSLDSGALEYGGSSLGSLFAQRQNLVRLRFWQMLTDLVRFYRTAPSAVHGKDTHTLTLGALLERGGYGDAFVNDHLLPMAAAIWSAPPETLKDYPATAFIRFCMNHGLLDFAGRPPWRTVAGGSRTYVTKLASAFKGEVRLGTAIRAVHRNRGAVVVETKDGTEHFDKILIATHADTALSMLADASDWERQLLSAFAYTDNLAVLHRDDRLMPRRQRVWSSWNYIGKRNGEGDALCVTYWMNKLQPLRTKTNLFVTLNPPPGSAPRSVIHTESYAHPVFTSDALRAQDLLRRLQGDRNTWFCGAYFGAGFHEDGLKSGLDAAEQMGGARRPWPNGGGTAHESLGARPAVRLLEAAS